MTLLRDITRQTRYYAAHDYDYDNGYYWYDYCYTLLKSKGH